MGIARRTGLIPLPTIKHHRLLGSNGYPSESIDKALALRKEQRQQQRPAAAVAAPCVEGERHVLQVFGTRHTAGAPANLMVALMFPKLGCVKSACPGDPGPDRDPGPDPDPGPDGWLEGEAHRRFVRHRPAELADCVL